jgi:hypothetical protein
MSGEENDKKAANAKDGSWGRYFSIKRKYPKEDN